MAVQFHFVLLRSPHSACAFADMFRDVINDTARMAHVIVLDASIITAVDLQVPPGDRRRDILAQVSGAVAAPDVARGL